MAFAVSDLSFHALIECGVAETRGALMKNGTPIEFCFAPALGDEKRLRRFIVGDVFLSRVRRISRELNGAFVDIGDEKDGFIPFNDCPKNLHEGSKVLVRIRREALSRKGAVLSLDWRKDLPEATVQAFLEAEQNRTPPCKLTETGDAITEIINSFSIQPTSVQTNYSTAKNILQSAYPGMAIEIERNVFGSAGADVVLEEAFLNEMALPGGGRLIIEETEGPCVMDVDSAVARKPSAARMNDTVNAAAVQAAFLALSRRGVGGRIIIDFLPPSNEKALQSLRQHAISTIVKPLGGRSARLARDGVFDTTIPRRRPSLLSRATETFGEGAVRPGRRFTIDWMAKSAIGALEAALDALPSSRPTLYVGGLIDAHLTQNAVWLERLSERYGPRFHIEKGGDIGERSFDLKQ